MPSAEIKSAREPMETNDNDLINGSKRRALLIDNRGAYKSYAALPTTYCRSVRRASGGRAGDGPFDARDSSLVPTTPGLSRAELDASAKKGTSADDDPDVPDHSFLLSA